MKVESCQKLHQNLDVFGPPILEGGPSKKCTDVMTPLAARGLEKFLEGTLTSHDVIVAHTLNFRPNFRD